ncbi:MAG: enoyl-CoA hydratase/carnithine racemase [Parvibaculaceae bacterium]|jgi:enoyl-CoA hydratase/carnithine racemase
MTSPPSASTPAPALLRTDHEGITTLTLNRASARNSLSEALLDALTTAFENIAEDESVRVVILAANGPAFSAGHDLKELQAHRGDADKGRAYYTDIMNRCATMMQKIVSCPKPVIAQIQGIATAAGCQLVASCDLAIAADTAKFATPGVNIGLFCSTPMVALTRNVSRKHAMEMLLLGDMISAQKACDIGLINKAVTHDQLETASQEMAQMIASKSSLTLAMGKEAFYTQIDMELADAYHHASDVMVHNMLTHDSEEGIEAFLAKRTPLWKDR